MKKQPDTSGTPATNHQQASKSQPKKQRATKKVVESGQTANPSSASGLAKLDNILKQSKDQISQEVARLQSQQKKRPVPSSALSPKNHSSYQKSVHEASFMSGRSVEKAKALAEEDRKSREEARKLKKEKATALREHIQLTKDEQARAVSKSKSKVTQEKQDRALQIKREKEALKEKKKEKELIERENLKKLKLLVELVDNVERVRKRREKLSTQSSIKRY